MTEARVVAPGGAHRARFADGRWHFQHGPIDCILGADGDPAAVAACIEAAWLRFEGILAELVAELPLLRTDLASRDGAAVAPRGPVARRMVAACRAHAHGGRFITAMAAVAGSVAEELVACFASDARVERAYVNNGGDIALHLAAGARPYEVGIVADADRHVVRAAARLCQQRRRHRAASRTRHAVSRRPGGRRVAAWPRGPARRGFRT